MWHAAVSVLVDGLNIILRRAKSHSSTINFANRLHRQLTPGLNRVAGQSLHYFSELWGVSIESGPIFLGATATFSPRAVKPIPDGNLELPIR